ncbi:uncharacterized protein LOC125234959 [Leguminivora glycinivorella]|uniref:uncharacterized protein LOC125234959 n=1 Tax=Leguminivora glycinivorella TaxID=1035111 RepID=UPI00200ED758|nr:uncharacterized protein LOC125234959 [Leguminivora glycinivorella]
MDTEIATETRKATARQLEMQLKTTAQDLHESRALSKQLLEEREESEVELQKVINKNSELRRELADNDVQLTDARGEVDRLQGTIDTFNQCASTHEVALARITQLEEELGAANEELNLFRKEREHYDASQLQNVYQELCKCYSASFTYTEKFTLKQCSSDFEYHVIQSKKDLDSEDESGSLKTQKKTTKRKNASQIPKRDAGWSLDRNVVEECASKSKKIKPKKTVKKHASSVLITDTLQDSDTDLDEEDKTKSTTTKSKKETPDCKPGWFSNWGDEGHVEAQRRASAANSLSSVLIRRVPGGYVRRTASLTGDLFIDLKLYNVVDIQNVPSEARWEKALVNFKYRVDSVSDIVDGINKILKRCKDDFTDEGTFFPDKKSQ